MTLIAAYRSGPNHVMAGDLLLTSSSPVTPTPGIPTRFEGNLHLVNNRIYGLEQKIFPVNSHLAVGWSANKRYIPDIIIRDIANNIATPPYTTATIREIERRLDSYPTDRCHFMFLLLIN